MLLLEATTTLGTFSLDVSVELPTPGVVALFGRSGSGKTSVVNIIAGLLDPRSGRVVLEDTVLLDTRRRLRVPPERRRMGYVFQDARLFPHLSVAANLHYGRRRAGGATRVDFDAAVDLLGLSALMGRRTRQLSGGERQRVAIARALLSQPRLLLLDEPLAGLDAARREEVLPYLENLRDKLRVPMVYVTHDFDEVLRLATHMVLLEAGSVIAQGPVDAMSLHPHLRSIVGRDAVGAIVDGVVIGGDAGHRLTRVRVGHGELHVQASGLAAGTMLRVQLLARDIIISTERPRYLSVRNALPATITAVHDDGGADLVTLDIGGAHIMARVTQAATHELALLPGMRLWALVKSVSLRGHAFAAPPPHPPKPGVSPGA